MLKILAGVHEHDGGVITLGGAPFIAGSPQASIDQGIAVIYQEPSLFLDLSLAENVFIGRQPKKGIAIEDATTFAGDLEFDSLTVMDFVAEIEDSEGNRIALSEAKS